MSASRIRDTPKNFPRLHGQCAWRQGLPVSSEDRGERGRSANDVCWRRIALARKALRNGSSKSEREPTSARSTSYGSGLSYLKVQSSADQHRRLLPRECAVERKL